MTSSAGRSKSGSAGYWPQPWSCEDGGPRRLCNPVGQAGPDIQPGERLVVESFRDAFASDMLIRREPGELYALRHDIPVGDPLAKSVDGWVEKLDPETLEVIVSSPRFPSGKYWPGGIAVHANGDIYMVFGCWAHRLNPDLEVLVSRQLPVVDRPYNSFVILDTGELVTKDCDAPDGLARSTLSILDPETLESVAPELELPEPSIARLAADGENVVVVGTETVFRITLDRDAGKIVVDDTWRPRFGPAPGRSYGWDPVISDEHVFWMDQGRNSTDWTMRDSGDAPDPVRLWWARRDDADTIRSVEISGLPYGTESNPPAWDPVNGVVIGYDAGNAVLTARKLVGDELEPLWRRDDFAHAGHLILYPDTRELVVQDWRDLPLLRQPHLRRAIRPVLRFMGRAAVVRKHSKPIGYDQLVVLDLDTGIDKGRVDIPSPSQAFLFPAPGWGRDIYYQSMTSMARVTVTDR
ncbi:MAG: hypothetical protein JJE13_00060 [Thermoleophilia bacterium]|nr:hypothetical protein [Thermoleophilia bacterium]